MVLLKAYGPSSSSSWGAGPASGAVVPAEVAGSEEAESPEGGPSAQDVLMGEASPTLSEQGYFDLRDLDEVESEDEARAWKPTVVHVDAQNRIVPIAGEVPGPQRRLWPV